MLRSNAPALAAGCLIFLSACAAEIAERPPALDPASPQAQESPAPGPPTLNQPDPTLAAPSTRAAIPAGAPSLYACPMHPDFRAPEPGRCPTCGMTLQPIAPADGSRR